MKEGTSIHVLQQGKLNKLFSYWEPQTCIPRKAEELEGGGSQVHANGSQDPSGPTRTSALGHCGVQFTQTGAWSPQDLLVGGPAEEKGEEM